jgi:two-component system, chemotaxis family, chemotaxis protein CheY
MAATNSNPVSLQTGSAAIGTDVGLKVMVVDDQASMRRIVRQLLASNGIRDVLEAGDGAEALEQLQKPEHAGVDLVICDLMMPVMDGLTFCNQMRRDLRLKSRHVPILLLTAVTDELVLQVARQVGALDVANKPIAASELGRRIEHLVGIKLH